MEQERVKIEETDYPEFDVKKMERFIKKDLFAAKLFEGLKSSSKESRLETVFNSCVLDDSLMTKSYESA